MSLNGTQEEMMQLCHRNEHKATSPCCRSSQIPRSRPIENCNRL